MIKRDFIEYLTIPYKHLASDCYALVKTFYKQELQVDLPNLEYELKWAEAGKDLILSNYSKFGFVESECFSYGNVLVFEEGGISRHLGICLGDSTFLHTTRNGTARHSYTNSEWSLRITKILEYKP